MAMASSQWHVALLALLTGRALARRSPAFVLSGPPPLAVHRAVAWRRPLGGGGCTIAAVGFGPGAGRGQEGEAITASNWSLQGLRKEADRQVYRQLKKVGKAEQRLAKAQDEGGEWNGKHEDEFGVELEEAQDRLARVQALEAALRGLKSTRSPVFAALEPEIAELGLSDKPPTRKRPSPKKAKAKPPPGPRLPYRTYVSADGVEIRVGRSAADNDDLSTNPEHRLSTEWWLHAAGAAGSHVVIRCSAEADELPRNTVKDAAALAAKYSKAGGGKVAVSLTRCRNVSKPGGTKPGLVYLSGDVATIRMDLRAEAERLERLEAGLAAQGTN